MVDLDFFVSQKLKKIKAEQKLRALQSFTTKDNTKIIYQGKELISFATNDYFGLACDDEIREAAIGAVKQYGVGAKSARLICGNYDIYTEIEKNLAILKGTEKAVVFSSGYLAAIGVIPSIISRKDLVVGDKLIHASLLDGIKLSGANLRRFSHNDYYHLEYILKNIRDRYENCLIISETIFSMDGDCVDIEKLLYLAEKYKCWLLTDDAHGIGLIKKTVLSDYGLSNYIQLGTLSKGIGAYGGYVATSKKLCDYFITAARSFIYSTALPFPVISAANKAVEILVRDHRLLLDRLKGNIEYFAVEMDFENKDSPIFIVEMESIEVLVQMHRKLIENGIYVAMIRPPTVKKPRIRITLSVSHSKQEVKKLCDCLKRAIY